MNHLISYWQIDGNLRRAAKEGLISLLSRQQLEKLALKHFGSIDEKTGLLGYQCPYSGKIYTNYDDIVLEHIIPITSKGGTVLFNCIPVSKEVNNKKWKNDLISWWTNPDNGYWDEEAPLRLEKLVNYILEGYEQVFQEYTIEEVENSYLEIDSEENILDEKDKIEINIRRKSEELKQTENKMQSYLGIIISSIEVLEKNNINTFAIKERLHKLEEQKIFKDIEKYQLCQNVIKNLIVSRIDNSNSYLTYARYFDIRKIMIMIDSDNEEYIYNELNSRLQNIELLLKENNLSIIEYFKSLRDIREIDILYKNNITSEEINLFLENIKIGIDTKIEIYIKMLNQGKKEIIKVGNDICLEGYPNIKLANFWGSYKDEIKTILFEKQKDNPEYDTARQTILTYFKVNSYDELKAKQNLTIGEAIDIYIKMLNQGKKEILKSGNDIYLEGYPSVKLAHYWNTYQDEIKTILFEKQKDNPEYDTARQTILTYFKVNSYDELKAKQNLTIDEAIDIYIKMLNKGNIKILTRGNKITLTGYPSIKLANFWGSHQDKIKNILFEKLKDNPEYDTARQTILTYFKVNSYDELKAKQNLTTDEAINIYIKMLNQGNSEILIYENKLTLEGYPYISLSYFWGHFQDKIKTILFEKQKDNPEYDTARQTILTYFKVNSYDELKAKQNLTTDEAINIYIKMLNQGNSGILKKGNNMTLTGYPSIKLDQFWNTYQDKIKTILFEKQKDNHEYDIARQTILIYFKVNSYDELEFKKQSNLYLRIINFINVLNSGNINVLKSKNKETFMNYPNINIGDFWYSEKNRNIIIKILFIKLKDNSEYDTAREIILDQLKIKCIEEYYDKIENESKKMKENKKLKIQLEETIKIIDNIYEKLNTVEEQRKRA